MPTHYEIVYLNVSGDPECGQGATVTAKLVQDYIAEYPASGTTAEYIDWINIYYTPGDTPTPFTLYLKEVDYKIYVPDPRRIITEPLTGDPDGSTLIPTQEEAANQWKLVFSVPPEESTTVFEFGVGTPGTKLKVKVKKQTASFSRS